MAGGSLAERREAHQRPGLDEHRGACQHALLDDLVRPAPTAGSSARAPSRS
jgi:hypothetical protein